MKQGKALLIVLTIGVLFCIVCNSAFQVAHAQDKKDTVRVSVASMDNEISDLKNQYVKLSDDIKQAQENLIYLRGAIEMLAKKRQDFIAADTAKHVAIPQPKGGKK